MSAGARRPWLPASLTAAWDRASPRERRFAAAGALVVGLAACWALAWRPMQADVARTREELARATQTLARARLHVDESTALARETKTSAPGDPRGAIARAFAERGVPVSGRLDIQDGRVKVILPETRFDRLVAALDAMRRDEGIRAVEVTITARVEPGTVRAELALAR